MKSAYKSSGAIFEQVSKMHSPGMYEQLKAVKPGEITVVRGTYDHIELLMDTLKVNYQLIEPEEMGSKDLGRVALVNCRTYGNGKSVDAARKFVSGGGRLVTTDWALSLVTHAFPDRLAKTSTETSDDVVEVQCASNVGSKLLGLHYSQCHPKWWLEGSSHIYTIKKDVVSIITSPEMKTKYGQPYVAVGFNEGDGDVYHFISHLELQRTHLRTEADKGGLEDFLAKMDAKKTTVMEDCSVAELEAAFSTLNTLAYLCLPGPLLDKEIKPMLTEGPSKTCHSGKSVLLSKAKK
ncbi:MAG: hypothetical protein AABX47_08740 [Nanoarchaeota archaeon]